MVPVGNRPILWHVMKYYAHFGHTDFILCLGHKAEVIKEFFLNYEEALSNDFVLDGSRSNIELLSTDTHDWRITFVDTGLRAKVGERLMAVREHLEGEEMFLANYGDTLTNAPLTHMIDRFASTSKVASALCVRPQYTFHVMSLEDDESVLNIQDVTQADLWINGGYFVLRNEIFEYMRPGEDLVVEPFKRLIEDHKLLGYRYDGFWAPMDTLKDKQVLENLVESGRAPWRVWDNPTGNGLHGPTNEIEERLARGLDD
jgi:glucose-1-phosphate cytidylyltransferase